MNIKNPHPLGRASAAFALAATVTVLFNTALAWAKDAYSPLNKFMASLTGHDWTTHAVTDILVFIALGLIFLKTGVADKIDPNRLINGLMGAVILTSLGLVGWYFVF